MPHAVKSWQLPRRCYRQPFVGRGALFNSVSLAIGLFGADFAQAQEGPLIYVPNLGSNDVSVIDTPTNTVAPTAIPFSQGPLAAAVRSDQSLVYVTNIGDNTVSVVDTSSNTVIATVAVALALRSSRSVLITPAPTWPTKAATTLPSSTPRPTRWSPPSRSAAAYRPSGQPRRHARLCDQPVFQHCFRHQRGNKYGGRHHPGGCWSSRVKGHSRRHSRLCHQVEPATFLVISTATNTVVATIPVGLDPRVVTFTPDGTRAYVANFGSNTVSVIDTATNTVVGTIPVGIQPTGVVITPDGTAAYVTNTVDNTVSIINIATNTIVSTLPVGLARWLAGICSNGNAFSGPGSLSGPTPAARWPVPRHPALPARRDRSLPAAPC